MLHIFSKRWFSIFFIFWAALVICFGVNITATHAAEFKSGNSVHITKDQTINDDLYISASDVSVDGTVNGNVFVVGGTTQLNGPVTGDVFVAGGTITINGAIGRSVHIVGGTVTISSAIGKDLLLFGGNATLEKSGSVAGVTKIGAGQLQLAGTTKDVDAAVGSLTVVDTAKINGNLTYTTNKPAVIDRDAVVTGKTTQKQVETKTSRAHNSVDNEIFGLLFTIVMAGLLFWLLPHKTVGVTKSMLSEIVPNALRGTVFFVVSLFLMLFLFITLIGIPLAMIILLFWFVGWLTGIIGLGTWLVDQWQHRSDHIPNFLTVVIGAVAMVLIGLIPAIGGLFAFLAFVTGLGAVVRYDWDLLKDLRSDKKI